MWLVVSVCSLCCSVTADLMINSQRVVPELPHGDGRARQTVQGLDTLTSPAVTIPANVYPPIVPQLLQSKVQPSMQQSSFGGALPSSLSPNDSIPAELKSKVKYRRTNFCLLAFLTVEMVAKIAIYCQCSLYLRDGLKWTCALYFQCIV